MYLNPRHPNGRMSPGAVIDSDGDKVRRGDVVTVVTGCPGSTVA